MKVVRAYRIDIDGNDIQKVRDALGGLPDRQRIDVVNWDKYRYSPCVSFSAAYNRNLIFLRYYVRENFFKAEKTDPCSEVYEDSSVEFFVAPRDDGNYYNFEFNAIGTGLMASGTSRHGRECLTGEAMAKVLRMGSAGSQPIRERAGIFEWDLTVVISSDIFSGPNLKDLEGTAFRVNFYKCGDRLKVPHYLTWNSVGTTCPDFHQPSFFGLMHFI